MMSTSESLLSVARGGWGAAFRLPLCSSLWAWCPLALPTGLLPLDVKDAAEWALLACPEASPPTFASQRGSVGCL